MGISWTTEQQQVITMRDSNLLVSAAAGSGKTAVLVARILSRIRDKEHPVDIDRLLVVTFTRAAAGEMKERIGRELEKCLEQEPDNVHLQRQGVLLDHAQINTIDGFCTFVLQNYFHRIDLDPGYRIAEEDELKILQARVLEDMLEEEYAAAEAGSPFLRFAEAYGSTGSDDAVKELISRMYAFAVSNPDPDLWLETCLEAYTPGTEEELEGASWMQLMLSEADALAAGITYSAGRLLKFVENEPAAPQTYLPMLREDAENLEGLKGGHTYREFREALSAIQFSPLSRSKGEDEDPELREQVRKQRDRIKKEVQSLQNELFGLPLQDVLLELAALRPFAQELVRLVRRFREAFTEAKRSRNLLDFSDLELLALQILTEKDEGGQRVPSEAAQELAERFEEVMIDEYQDSNYLQEALLSSVSRPGGDRQNRFMVGDIKQSIYGFRQARPDLFLKKQRMYTSGKDQGQSAGVRIDLHQNFRSRPEVLDSVNAVFSRLMIPELGGILYDDAAALHAGAPYPECPVPGSMRTELLIVDKKDDVFQENRQREVLIEAEAHTAAVRIRDMVRNGQLWDADKNEFRPVTYRDCVILLRAASTQSDVFVRVLQEEGVPAYAVFGKGYFRTIEVSTVLNYLRICDNPLQDIPLAAVLRSPIGRLTDADLAEIRAAFPGGSLYAALQAFCAERPEERTAVSGFLQQLERFRSCAGQTPIHTLIAQILDETGYGDYAAAMPAGAQRTANLAMLVERAVSYEKTRYHGLFSFIRYIEQLEESSVDFGEVNLYGEEENIVRIMTIHKSKGLEFPVVILAGLGNGYNRADENKRIVMHEKFGIGMAAVYIEERRTHMNTLLRTAIRRAIRQDAMAEELRILYVAMTRAKEKLILIGTGEETAPPLFSGTELTYQQILTAKSCLDWLRMALDPDSPVTQAYLRGADLVYGAAAEKIRLEAAVRNVRMICEAGRPGAYSAETRDLLAEKEEFRYNGEDAAGIPAKMTVSELKRAAVPVTEEDAAEELYPEETVVPYIPAFARSREAQPAEAEKLTGAARGTAYHHVFAALDYFRFKNAGDRVPQILREELDRMKEAGLLSEAEYDVVRVQDLCVFLESALGRRMAAAAEAGTLHREQPFVLDVPAEEIWPEISGGSAGDTEDRMVLVQGTIDAYWEENGAWILADYKTDHIPRDGGQELAERYHRQLEYYSKALTRITEMPVRERWIYSLYAGAVPVSE